MHLNNVFKIRDDLSIITKGKAYKVKKRYKNRQADLSNGGIVKIERYFKTFCKEIHRKKTRYKWIV